MYCLDSIGEMRLFSHNYFFFESVLYFSIKFFSFLIAVGGFIINMVYVLLRILQLTKIVYYDEEKSPKIEGKSSKKDE
jgi:hypothetical protein